MIRALDVIWIDDGLIRPPGPKRVACIEPELLLFFRINSEPKWQTPVKLERIPHHMFLKWDSYLECGYPLDLDEYFVEECIRDNGIIGRIHDSIAPAIYAAVAAEPLLAPADKERIRLSLGR